MSNFTLISPNYKPFQFEVFFKDLIKIKPQAKIQLNNIVLGVNKNIDFTEDQNVTFTLNNNDMFPNIKASDFTPYSPIPVIGKVRKGQYTFSELQSELQSVFSNFTSNFTMSQYIPFTSFQFDIDPSRDNDLIMSIAYDFESNIILNAPYEVNKNSNSTGIQYYVNTSNANAYDNYGIPTLKYCPFMMQSEQSSREGYINIEPTGSYPFTTEGNRTMALYSLNYGNSEDLVPGLDPNRTITDNGGVEPLKLVTDNRGLSCVASFISLEWTDSNDPRGNRLIVREAVNGNGVPFQDWTSLGETIASMEILYDQPLELNFLDNGINPSGLSCAMDFNLRTSASEALLPVEEQFLYITLYNGLQKNITEEKWEIYDSKAVGNFKLPLTMLRGLPDYDSENRVYSQNPFNIMLSCDQHLSGFDSVKYLSFKESDGTPAEPAVNTVKYTVSVDSELAQVLGNDSFFKNPNFGFPTIPSILHSELTKRGDTNPNYIIRDLSSLYRNNSYTVSIENLPIENRKNKNIGNDKIIFSGGNQQPILSNVYYPFKDGIEVKDNINNKEQIQGIYRPYYPIVTELNNITPLDLNSFQISIRDLETHDLSEEITKVILDFTIF
jgi:hypothetical protein